MDDVIINVTVPAPQPVTVEIEVPPAEPATVVIQEAEDGEPGPPGQGLVFRGEWAENELYSPQDLATFEGSVYVVIDPSGAQDTNAPPINGSWALFAAKGDAGAPGAPGSDATVNATNVAAAISGQAEKATPVDADKIPLVDSAAAGALKWLSCAKLWDWIASGAMSFRRVVVQGDAVANMLELNLDPTTSAKFSPEGTLTIRNERTSGGERILLTLDGPYGVTNFYGTHFSIQNINLVGTNTLHLNRGGGNVAIGPYLGNPLSKLAVNGNLAVGSANALAAAPANGFLSQGDVELSAIGSGFVLRSANGSRWRIGVSNAGVITASTI